MLLTATESFIDEVQIENLLTRTAPEESVMVREILAKARGLKGLSLEDVAQLMAVNNPELLDELFAAARWVKSEIYGDRLVLFAPLYISNYCSNECSYCAFRAGNTELQRRALTQEKIAREVRFLVEQGHKRILLVSGEAYPRQEGLDYILNAVDTIYKTRSGRGEIRRVNVNIAPLSTDDFRRLKGANIGTYQLFQETYHRKTYNTVHLKGKKRDFDWRVTAMHRAMEAGIDDVGIGPLFGLYDWRFEVLAMMQHIRRLEQSFGVGPHTISVPRMEPATGSEMASAPPYMVSDADFMKLVAILRLAVPYTGIIMSTRESAAMRNATFALGVSQISGGSRTNPGGYTEKGFNSPHSQFQLGDHRSLDEVIHDVATMGYIPSFCTACYRLGRTGQDFMDVAKPGEIKYHCAPNALSTFLEYLDDYASSETREIGKRLIATKLKEMDQRQQSIANGLLGKVGEGERDVFV